MNKVLVQTEKLGKTYLNGKIVALEEVDLVVEKGEFISILGPSGSGKTTLLNIIGALDKATSGRVAVDGFDLSEVRDLSRFRSERIGFVFQLHNLIPSLDAHSNIQIPMYPLKMGAKERASKATELLDIVGLKGRARHTPAMLSGGERQRVAMARGLANSPLLVLVDEPTGNLDHKTGQEIIDLMRRLNSELGTTFIIATHDLNVAKSSSRVVQLSNAKLEHCHIPSI
ncbi:MAG: ABC transporter ATP-binding protein [Dehalococcoidia bacterium]|nr:ABC transporter ATP-binding protein [Dehalococcoidia bacterium]